MDQDQRDGVAKKIEFWNSVIPCPLIRHRLLPRGGILMNSNEPNQEQCS
jgi:hypothetical protein